MTNSTFTPDTISKSCFIAESLVQIPKPEWLDKAHEIRYRHQPVKGLSVGYDMRPGIMFKVPGSQHNYIAVSVFPWGFTYTTQSLEALYYMNYEDAINLNATY